MKNWIWEDRVQLAAYRCIGVLEGSYVTLSTSTEVRTQHEFERKWRDAVRSLPVTREPDGAKHTAPLFCDVQDVPRRCAFRLRRILQTDERQIHGADGQEKLPRAPGRLLSDREVGSQSAQSLISCGSQLLKLASGSAQSV